MTESPTRFTSVRTLLDLLSWRAERDRGQRAFVFLDDDPAGAVERSDRADLEEIGYAELDRRARTIAIWLLGVSRPGERALLFYPPGIDYIAVFFGCLYAGVVAVPAYPPQPNRRIRRIEAMAVDAGATVALAPQEFRTTLESLFASEPALAGVRLETPAEEEGAHRNWQKPDISGDTLAMLQYTSGSTGVPRGVMVAHQNLVENLAAMAWMLDGTPRGTEPRPFQQDPERYCEAVSWLPPYHDMGLIGGILMPLYAGRPAALMSPAAFLQRPARWLEAISRYRAAHSIAPNFGYDLCTRRVTSEQRQGLSLERWDLAMCGGEPIQARTARRFAETFAPAGFRAAAFYPCYGMAEATLMVTGRPLDRPMAAQALDAAELRAGRAVETDESPAARVVVGCGRAVPGHQVVVVRPEDGTPCPPGEVGEIQVSGPSVARGYWNRPEETARTFQADLAGVQDGGPYLRTGDLGFLRGDELFVTGRAKDLIIIRGRNHYPQDIEATVESSHPALRPAAVVAFSVEDGAEPRLVVVGEVERPHGIEVAEVIGAVRQAVAEEHELRVDAVVLVRPGSVPKTSSGKLQRGACRDGYLAADFPVVGEWHAVVGAEPVPDEEAPAVPPASALDPVTGPARGRSAAEIEQWLVARLGGRLGVDPRDIDVAQPLARYGLDSKEAVAITGELADWLGIVLPATLAYEYPTIGLIARHLTGEPASFGDRDRPERDWTRAEPIAIIGIGCRFPGADGPEGLWSLLSGGVDAIREVPAGRWDGVHRRAGDLPGLRWGGFLDRVDLFDPEAFGISPREAASMDPQQRLLLEVGWEALEDAGQPVHGLAGTDTGVFVGISSNDYGQRRFDAVDTVDAYAGTGNALSISANRLSYQFDLRGPSLAVDTACSSSLVAVHLAVQSLRDGRCGLALAGGVNVMLSPGVTAGFAKAGFMAPDGRCKSFDADADGYVRGEGAGMVVLKPLSHALADGDPVYAVILGSAVNSDGRTNGLTAPSIRAQESVLRAAYRDAGVPAGRVRYVEAHGTGTALGDPIEARALAGVLGEERPESRPCLIGSIKTNVGHLEAAAGIAGLIKTALSLWHRRIPPSLHFHRPNPQIPFHELPLRVVRTPLDWPDDGEPALAGVSAFGFGGTNAHVVLEEGPRLSFGRSSGGFPAAVGDTAPATPEPVAAQLLPLSAHSPDALRELARDCLKALTPTAERPPVGLADLCHSTGALRTHLDHRLAVGGATRQEVAAGLRSFLADEAGPGVAAGRRAYGRPPRLAFVFSGQGVQWWGMARDLLRQEPVFAAAVADCAELADCETDWSLLAELHADEAASRLRETAVAQPVLVAVQVGLAALWRSWGVEPDAVVGHSVGEISAAAVAGALTLSDAMRLAVLRGRIMQRAAGTGAMAAVHLGAAEARRAVLGCEDTVSVAAENSPVSSVLSGERAALDRVLARLADQGVSHRLLAMDYPFHSPGLRPFAAELPKLSAGPVVEDTSVAFYSTLTGDRYGVHEWDGDYWGRQLCEPVLFAAAMERLITDGHETFVEVGPDPALTGAMTQCLGARPGQVLASLQRGRDDRAALLETLGTLYATGHRVDWDAVRSPGSRRVRLPRYPWQRERHWAEPESPTASDGAGHRLAGGDVDAEAHPLLGRRTSIASVAGVWAWERRPAEDHLSYLAGHRIDGSAVLPAAAYVEMALAAARQVFPDGPCAVADMVLEHPLAVTGRCTIQTVLTRVSDRDLDFHICAGAVPADVPPGQDMSGQGAGGVPLEWAVHARGRVQRGQTHGRGNG
ncbi:beta-ketoacyl synthase N-terminal-like domain-containing protein [Nonomuraea sp. NPDC051191]|uniref:beta-ketoacyl synthase N-terminal-like domain-containing protein n=1 Tax=Nonomuraea sp. NPDC051191 TaxID=3364372 RepID=UPI0037B027D0